MSSTTTSTNNYVCENVDFEILDVPPVSETTTSNEVCPSDLRKMYAQLMKDYKELKQKNKDLLKKNEVLNLINEDVKRDNEELKMYRDGERHAVGEIFRLKDENKALNKKMEQLKNKHDAEMQSMRFHSNHNATIASKRSLEIKKLEKENEDMKVVINGLVDDKKDLVRAYKQPIEETDEIERLKLENKQFRERNAQLNDDRSILRGVVNDLRSVISCQHNELVMWQDYYTEQLNYKK